jgi:hypothetical protein
MSLEQEFLEEFGTFTVSEETPEHKGLGWSPRMTRATSGPRPTSKRR